MERSLHIVMTFPHPLGTPGGGTVHCIQLATHLKKAGARLRLLPLQSGGVGAFRRRPVPPEALSRSLQVQSEMQAAGIPVDPVPAHPVHFVMDGLALWRRLREISATERIDVVIGWHHEAFALASFARKSGWVPAMMAAGSYGALRKRLPRKFFLKTMLRHNFRKAQVIFAASEFSRRQIVDVFGLEDRRIATVPLGIGPGFFRARREFRPGPVARLFFLGQISQPKGFFDLLAALAQVRAQGHAAWELHAAGGGDIEQARSAADSLGIGGQVHFLGYSEADIIIRHLEESHLAVMPSYTESFGLAVAECLASGLPVIACDAGAVPELIHPGQTGWLVPVRDAEALAQALCSGMEDLEHTFRMGLAGRASMEQGYTWEKTAGAVLQRLEEAASRPAKGGSAL